MTKKTFCATIEPMKRSRNLILTNLFLVIGQYEVDNKIVFCSSGNFVRLNLIPEFLHIHLFFLDEFRRHDLYRGAQDAFEDTTLTHIKIMEQTLSLIRKIADDYVAIGIKKFQDEIYLALWNINLGRFVSELDTAFIEKVEKVEEKKEKHQLYVNTIKQELSSKERSRSKKENHPAQSVEQIIETTTISKEFLLLDYFPIIDRETHFGTEIMDSFLNMIHNMLQLFFNIAMTKDARLKFAQLILEYINAIDSYKNLLFTLNEIHKMHNNAHTERAQHVINEFTGRLKSEFNSFVQSQQYPELWAPMPENELSENHALKAALCN